MGDHCFHKRRVYPHAFACIPPPPTLVTRIDPSLADRPGWALSLLDEPRKKKLKIMIDVTPEEMLMILDVTPDGPDCDEQLLSTLGAADLGAPPPVPKATLKLKLEAKCKG